MLKKYPVIRLTLSLAFGILLQRYQQLPVLQASIITSSLLVLNMLPFFLPLSSRIRIQNILIYPGIISAGILLYSINNPRTSELPFHNHAVKKVTAAGKIIDKELKRDGKVIFTIESGALITEDTAITRSFTLLCTYKDTVKGRLDSIYEFLKPGYIVSFSCSYSYGKDIRNPGEFDYASYLREKGIAGVLSLLPDSAITYKAGGENVVAVQLLALRNAIGDRIEELFSPDAAGLAKGLLLGDKDEISSEIQTKFINSGVAHVLAVSGLNVAFVSLIIFLLLGRFSLKVRYAASALGITIFWLIAGNSPSVARAALMGYIVIINYYMGRDTSGLNTLFVTAFIILVFAPYDLFSPSFQLSFGGILALLLVHPPFQEMIHKLPLKSKFTRNSLLYISLTFAAQLGVIPITDYYFGKISLTSFGANLFVVPLTNIIMGTQILSLFVSVIWYPLAQIQAAGCDLLTAVLYYTVRFCGSDTYSYIPISNFTNTAVVFYYILLAIFLYYFRQFTSAKAKIALLTATVAALAMFHSVVSQPILEKGKLNILAIDIGQGDATLIVTPDGTSILADAGNATNTFDNGKRVILPLLDRLNISKIDYAIISHLDADHYKGIFAILNEGKIKTLIKPPAYKPYEDSLLTHFARMSGAQIIIPKDSAWHVGGCALYFLDNEAAWRSAEFSQNDKSLCFKLQYGETSALILGDAQAGREKLLEENCGPVLHAGLLKVAHHGSKHGTTSAFLDAVSPTLSLISVGERNVYHHPHHDVLDRLKIRNIPILRTDQSGAILLTSDGKQITQTSWRN